MPADIISYLVVLVVLLALSAFFSSSETVMISLNPLQVRALVASAGRRGRQIRMLLAEPARLLSAILIANIFINVSLAAIGYSLAEVLFPGSAEAIAIPVMTLLLLFFGEIGPKRYGLAHAERLAPLMVTALVITVRITRPFQMLLEFITSAAQHLFTPRGRTLTGKEFETVLEIGGEEGALEDDELAMAKAVFRLDDLKAADVMTPRVDLEGVDIADEKVDLQVEALHAKRKRLLLYRDQIDEVEGFLDVRRFLLDPERRSENARIKPLFVPETAPLNRVLELFHKTGLRIAVVVDEYGGTEGVITRGDICEEITGWTYDDPTRSEPLLRAIGTDSWLVDPHFSLEEINRKLELRLHAENADRLSGWIAEHAGHLPRKGDVIVAQGCRVAVLQTRRHRITLAQVDRLEGRP